jgi:hypothetical protein
MTAAPDLSRLVALDSLALRALEAKGTERNRCVNRLLTAAHDVLQLVQAVDRPGVPVGRVRARADEATDGLPTELVLFERRHGKRGVRLVLRAAWAGDGRVRVSLASEVFAAGVWCANVWGDQHFAGRELGVVARFFADAERAQARAQREGGHA